MPNVTTIAYTMPISPGLLNDADDFDWWEVDGDDFWFDDDDEDDDIWLDDEDDWDEDDDDEWDT